MDRRSFITNSIVGAAGMTLFPKNSLGSTDNIHSNPGNGIVLLDGNIRYRLHGDRISFDEWQQRVNWVKQAHDISIFGAYDGPADCQYWGIANTSALPADGAWSCAKYPGDQAYGYFNIVRDAMASKSGLIHKK